MNSFQPSHGKEADGWCGEITYAVSLRGGEEGGNLCRSVTNCSDGIAPSLTLRNGD
ncbi:MAG TPA: hypothetical protein H9717_09405 [Candidatus Eisenbergiella merdipullorum]|uniref:Uncharacterized protein n=1 Tax=Candidatus Eisenbergiella merdipullorum TaxID=2838553 RepID=A0A9D2I6M6_9FIRM|nr:hypothetical protein [Candidatus Eisenbergiella merdipullorum]